MDKPYRIEMRSAGTDENWRRWTIGVIYDYSAATLDEAKREAVGLIEERPMVETRVFEISAPDVALAHYIRIGGQTVDLLNYEHSFHTEPFKGSEINVSHIDDVVSVTLLVNSWGGEVEMNVKVLPDQAEQLAAVLLVYARRAREAKPNAG